MADDDNIKTPDLRYPPLQPNMDRQKLEAQFGVGDRDINFLDFNVPNWVRGGQNVFGYQVPQWLPPSQNTGNTTLGNFAREAIPGLQAGTDSYEAFQAGEPVRGTLKGTQAVAEIALPSVLGRAASKVIPGHDPLRGAGYGRDGQWGMGALATKFGALFGARPAQSTMERMTSEAAVQEARDRVRSLGQRSGAPAWNGTYGGPRDLDAPVSLSRNNSPDPDRFHYGIYRDGKYLGYARGTVNGDRAWISWIGGGNDAANSIGVSGVKALREGIRQDFPGVKVFSGNRGSGSRRGKAARRGLYNSRQTVKMDEWLLPVAGAGLGAYGLSDQGEEPAYAMGGPVTNDAINRAKMIARRYQAGGRVGEFARRQVDPAPDAYTRSRRYEDDGGLYSRHYHSHMLNDPFRRMNRTRDHSFLDRWLDVERPEGIGVLPDDPHPAGTPYAEGGPVEPYLEGGSGGPTDAPVAGASWMDAPLPGAPGKSWRDLLSAMKSEAIQNPHLPFSMTGIPSMLSGADTLMDDNPGVAHKLSGAADIAMGALPMSRSIPGLSQGVNWATKTMPRTLMTYSGLSMPGAVENYNLINEANASDAQAATLPPEPQADEAPIELAADAGAQRPELPPLPEMPKKYEGEKRSKTQVQAIQQDLIKRGFLPPKKPDGRPSDDGDDGGGTREAELNAKMDAYDKALERRQKIMESMASGATAEAELKKSAEAKAAREAAAAKEKKYEKVKSAYDKDKSAWHTGTQMVAPFAGPALGTVIGGLWGLRTAYKGREAAREAMNVANKIIKGGAKYQADPKKVNERIANVNRFWTGPGSGTSVAPFEHVPKPGPRGPFWRPNQSAPVEPASKLYPPQSRAPELRANATMAAGVGGGEAAIGGVGLWMAYHDLEKAEAAAKANPTPETFADLELAKDKVAIAKGVVGMGPTTAALKAGIGSLGIIRRGAYQPDVNRADAERANLSEIIAKKKGAAAGKRGGQARTKKRTPPAGEEPTPEGGGSGSGGGPGMAPLLPLAATQLPGSATRSPEPSPDELAALPLPPEEEPRQDGGAVHHSTNQRRDRVGRFRGGFVKAKGSKSDAAPQDPTYRKVVNGAIRLARQYGGGVGALLNLDMLRKKRAYGGYAEGGAPMGDNIQVGPIMGHTGGREDAKPISVPSGSYVIPSDVVSAMGTGNTLAGMEMLKHAFGEAVLRGGQPTPIKISDGEYVLTPEQVSEIGRGDLDQGHRILDAFVKYWREHHIQTLQSLPGPAQS